MAGRRVARFGFFDIRSPPARHTWRYRTQVHYGESGLSNIRHFFCHVSSGRLRFLRPLCASERAGDGAGATA